MMGKRKVLGFDDLPRSVLVQFLKDATKTENITQSWFAERLINHKAEQINNAIKERTTLMQRYETGKDKGRKLSKLIEEINNLGERIDKLDRSRNKLITQHFPEHADKEKANECN